MILLTIERTLTLGKATFLPSPTLTDINHNS